MKDVAFALLGCGSVARKHVDAIARTEGARLVAVCDREHARAKAGAANVPAFSDAQRMLDAVPEIDVVCVLTPSGLHAAHTLDVAARGKHVLVEKPLALNVEDADAMIAACDRAGRQLFVVKQTRFAPAIRRLRAAVEAGRFGRLVMGTARVRRCRAQRYYDEAPWRGTLELDGGVLANQASHHLDLLAWLMGPVISVTATATRRLANIEAEDTAAALLRFANGAVGVIEATTAARPVDLESSLSIIGEGGAVEIAGLAVDRVKLWRFERPELADDVAFAEDSTAPGHAAVIDNVVRCVRGLSCANVDGREARKSVEIIEALRTSITHGGEIAIGAQQVQRLNLGKR
jgi:UDP-N-acetyl-2-amino-2-deoxyglucuronate dehydrogenase